MAQKGQRMDKLLYRAEEVSEVLGLGRTKVFALIARGDIRAVKIGGSTRVPADELRAYVERVKAESGLAPVA
jgi:excisionase family DNA binding protein